MDQLHIRGATENNLRSVDLRLPLGQWTAVTGPSGSGKTSLVFGVIVAEGRRRFLGSLSPKARQALGKLARGRGAQLEGLPPTVAPGSGEQRNAPRSTVGTLLGGLDFLRLLFAREGLDAPASGGEPVHLSRSHFSFNHPLGACPTCDGLGAQDQVDPDLLVADPAKSLRAGALVPTLKNGYTVYSQVTADVMQRICGAHGFDMETPWAELTKDQRDVILFGSRKLKVPFGKHSIESRMRWEGITARPREEGYYRGLIPVIEETLARSRNPGVLRFVRSQPCTSCEGTRLGEIGRRVRVGSARLPDLLDLSASDLRGALAQLPASDVLHAIRPSLEQRLERMVRLGLGHLALARPAGTLSGGEARRLALAAQLSAALGGQLVAMDEPTAGLHPEEQAGLGEVLEELLALGNTLVVVEHDPGMVRWADHLVSLGPGAGKEGGELVYAGALPEPPLGSPEPAPVRALGEGRSAGELVLRGARLHNLQGAELRLELGALNVVLGPSGSGKSSLVFGSLLPALSGEPGAFDELSGAPAGGVAAADARPIGRNPRSTPATWTGLFDVLRKRFAATPEAQAAGLKAGDFSYNSKGGRCGACEGLGVERIGLHLLENLERRCPACNGSRYGERVLGVRWRGLTIAEVLALDVEHALASVDGDKDLAPMVQALWDLGLGYLPLGQGSHTLSRGESQRIKLSRLLADPRSKPSVVLLDEPDRGLHPSDVAQLLEALRRLVEAGHTVVAISHHRALWEAADRCIEVRGGQVRGLDRAPEPQPQRPLGGPRQSQLPKAIQLRGVRTHNLRGIDVSIPHGKITCVCGVSGSGKSSLAFHSLAAEAWCRFAESLPFQVRRFVRRQPRPDLDEALGLTPVLRLEQGRGAGDPGPRSTLATATEIGPLLRLLWSRAGTHDGEPCGLSAESFSPDRALGACAECAGLGETLACAVELLVTDPSLPLGAGALGGTRVGRYLSEPGGQFLATLRAALGEAGLAVDPAHPWGAWSPQAQGVALHGTGDRSYAVTWKYERGGRAGKHEFEGPWPGLLTLAEREAARRVKQKAAKEWAAPLVPKPCAVCGGSGLGPTARDVRVGSLRLPDVLGLALSEVCDALGAQDLDDRQRDVFAALEPELLARCQDLAELGLGHLPLARRSQRLSGGERARVRLAGVLHGGLTGVTLVLDEPAAGLGKEDVGRLMGVLRRLAEKGNTVVLVEHRPEVLRMADELVELGPGAGEHGGMVVAQGPTESVLAGKSATARALRSSGSPLPVARPASTEVVRVEGIQAGPLRGVDLQFPAAGLVAITGPSGSGKSSLLFDVIEPSLERGIPVNCGALVGFERFGARALARPGQTVLASMGLASAVQALYRSVSKAAGADLSARAFSFDSPQGRCPECRGSGREAVALDALGDLDLPCPVCKGARFRPEVLGVRWMGRTIAEFLAAPVAELLRELASEAGAGDLPAALALMEQAGAGHLALGRRSRTLSGGESQRVAIAAALGRRAGPAAKPQVLLLDGPSGGLHEADLTGLVDTLNGFVDAGWLVLMAEQRPSLIACATEVRLGGGA